MSDTGAAQAREALRDLSPDQMSSVLMCFWVKDPTAFWKAVAALNPPHDPASERTPGHHSTCTCHLCEAAGA